MVLVIYAKNNPMSDLMHDVAETLEKRLSEMIRASRS